MSGRCKIVFYLLTLLYPCSAAVPKIKMNDGQEMPAIALGTFLGFDQNGFTKSKNKHLRDVICQAIDIGYRHFDTAAIYDSEEEIGEAIRIKIEEGVIKREDVFFTTKLWPTHHRREQVVEFLREELKSVSLNYVDLYLMHWPLALNEDYSFSDVDYLETWQGMEDARKLGLTKSIGVSNFRIDQLARLVKEANVKPAALQIEIHTQLVQSELVNYAQSQDIVVMAYSPFGSLVKRYGLEFPGPKLNDPVFTAMAEKYGKTSAQVLLRWFIDRNIVPIAKTVNETRLKNNIDIFDFKLTNEEIETVSYFNSNTRYTLPSFWQDHPNYPFEKIENPTSNPFLENKENLHIYT